MELEQHLYARLVHEHPDAIVISASRHAQRADTGTYLDATDNLLKHALPVHAASRSRPASECSLRGKLGHRASTIGYKTNALTSTCLTAFRTVASKEDWLQRWCNLVSTQQADDPDLWFRWNWGRRAVGTTRVTLPASRSRSGACWITRIQRPRAKVNRLPKQKLRRPRPRSEGAHPMSWTSHLACTQDSSPCSRSQV